MSMQELYPGRVFLGVGSGEALNEVPLGLDWPEPGEMLERFEAGLQAVTRLWDGETVTMDGGWFRLTGGQALHPRGRAPASSTSRPSGPRRAQIAARYGDGLWTMGDPESAPEVIDAYREARARDGREAGEIILQSGFNLAADEESAVASSRKWKATQLDEAYRATCTTRPRCWPRPTPR